ncbi:MAG TPA: LLM class flavin-dependent oxidoreductase [Nitrososphaerales archaeon]|nr:LLM class flavin-dependent oxidoreductase [Nitrososphaerales archaeon]
MEQTAIALRPELYSTSEIVDSAKAIDSIGSISNIFIPDIPGSLESLEIANSCLAVTGEVKIGSGVLRLHEHDSNNFLRRLETIQSLCGNRFVLGVGTGRGWPNPRESISRMLSQLDEIRANFGSVTHIPGLSFPSTYVAALREGMARKAIGHCDGLLLNFCSPEYARSIISKVSRSSATKFACYLKVFYAREERKALKLLVNEFSNYDALPNYHAMFVRDDIASAISEAKKGMDSGSINVPEALKKISIANPTTEKLKEYVRTFRSAGIGLPCVYPYFDRSEEHEYKLSRIREIAETFR